jgi:hypothetical protein
MNLNVIKQPDIMPALYGLGFNKGVTSDMSYSDFVQDESVISRMINVANELYKLSSEHRKFLRQIEIIVQINAPRYWWSEFDTYKIGTTAQSESTMHTILKQRLSSTSFASDDCLIEEILSRIDTIKQFKCSDAVKIIEIKKILPESFRQMRLVVMNYEVLANIIRQRKNHRLPEWRKFCKQIVKWIPYSEWVEQLNK